MITVVFVVFAAAVLIFMLYGIWSISRGVRGYTYGPLPPCRLHRFRKWDDALVPCPHCLTEGRGTHLIADLSRMPQRECQTCGLIEFASTGYE